MKIAKVFNNNVVLTYDQQNQELVVMGKGIAFQKKKGDVLDPEQVDKTFILQREGMAAKLAELLTDVPEQYLHLAEEIASAAAETLDASLDDYIYVSLTDHISYAVTRQKQGIELQNPILWEVRKFYPKEYEAGVEALDRIERATGVRLGEDEAASIALHLLNSQIGSEDMSSMVQVTKIVQNILTIVTYHFRMKLDETSVNYERFLTHLRFFAYRVIRQERAPPADPDDFLYEQVRKKYEDAFRCANKIAAYMEETYQRSVSKEEIVFLTLHLERVTSRQKNHSTGL
ncbi:BglG family transcription antiterminator LicT [Alkalicoccus chagannorensis]|uniref:BglG family transcription antiterminator LicT n=1 Tax=Alkalicoccus chagannorensis TaxID=427072 RepID=UPI00041E8605|nr:PRD domain-containing protein [Alkalicoccus chagannorensis]